MAACWWKKTCRKGGLRAFRPRQFYLLGAMLASRAYLRLFLFPCFARASRAASLLQQLQQDTWGLFSAKVGSDSGAMVSSAFNYYFLKAQDQWLPVEICSLNIDGRKPCQKEKCGLLAAGKWTLNQQLKQCRFIKPGFF